MNIIILNSKLPFNNEEKIVSSLDREISKTFRVIVLNIENLMNNYDSENSCDAFHDKLKKIANEESVIISYSTTNLIAQVFMQIKKIISIIKISTPVDCTCDKVHVKEITSLINRGYLTYAISTFKKMYFTGFENNKTQYSIPEWQIEKTTNNIKTFLSLISLHNENKTLTENSEKIFNISIENPFIVNEIKNHIEMLDSR